MLRQRDNDRANVIKCRYLGIYAEALWAFFIFFWYLFDTSEIISKEMQF